MLTFDLALDLTFDLLPLNFLSTPLTFFLDLVQSLHQPGCQIFDFLLIRAEKLMGFQILFRNNVDPVVLA